MNAFDFDNTIFRGDSTVRFYAYCFRKVPALWPTIPTQLGNALLFACRIRKKQDFKERMYRFLTRLPDVDRLLEAFWDENISRIMPWYIQMQREDDVIISASPEFLLKPAMRRLGIRHMMASRVDKKTGRYTGLNCHGEEKVVRFRAVFPDAHVEKFYSDSLSDTPMALLADEAWLVKNPSMTQWPR